MAYEWVGIAVVALAGIGATLLAGKLERGHSERMTREARQQERLAEAYVHLLVLVGRVGQWAQTVEPMWDCDPAQPVRPLPELDEQAETEAVISAYGSDEVFQAFEAWRDVVQNVMVTVNVISRDQAAGKGHRSNGGSVGESPYLRLHNLRPGEREARKALSRQVRDELRGRADSTEPPGTRWLVRATERAGQYLDPEHRRRSRAGSAEQPRRAVASDTAQRS